MKKLNAVILGIVVASAACGGGMSIVTGPDLLTYVGSSQVTGANPMRFSSKVVITNSTTESITFTPACLTPRVLVYSTAARTGTPIWDSKVRDAASLCAATPAPVTLAAGKSVTYTLTATGAEVLGATGIPSTYYLVNEVTLDGVPYRVSGGDIALAR